MTEVKKLDPKKASWNKLYFKGMNIKEFRVYWAKNNFDGDAKDYHKLVCGEQKVHK